MVKLLIGLAMVLIGGSFFILELSFEPKDLVIGFSVVIVTLKLCIGTTEYKFTSRSYFYFFFLFFWFQSAVMSYINLGQSFFEGLITSRIYFAYFMFLLALDSFFVALDEKTINRALGLISIALIFINFALFVTGTYTILPEDMYAFRDGQVRFLIGGGFSILLFLYFSSSFKDWFWSKVIVIGFLLVFIIVARTRSIFATMIILFTYEQVKNSGLFGAIKYYIILLVLVAMLFPLISDFNIEENITNLFTSSVNDISEREGNFGFRILEVYYFLSFLEPLSHIFGFGMPGKGFSDLFYENAFVSDIGVFGTYFYHGAVGLMLFVVLLIKLFKLGNRSGGAAASLLVLFVFYHVISGALIVLLYDIPAMMLVLFMAKVADAGLPKERSRQNLLTS
ncbi:MAG: hypothetical protein HWE07_08445 [Cytophagia bacterium]|nr:hypothetical protein [Cytophagia bacterium]